MFRPFEMFPVVFTVFIVFMIMRSIMKFSTLRDKSCKRCGNTFPRWGRFCPRCGQRADKAFKFDE